MSANKESIEQGIISRIFKNGDQCKIVKSEKPDFILNYSGSLVGDVSVGIEITELYYDDSSARLANKKGYVNDLLAGKYIHKDDKNKFNTKDVIYLSKNMEYKPFKTPLLFLPKYTIDDFRKAFLHTLRKKNKKHSKYNKDVNQFGLIIYDREKHFKKIKREDFVKAFFNDFIIDEIKNSYFEEIYLITCFDEGDDEFYIQLKYCLLQNELARLLEYIEVNSLRKKIKDIGLSFNDVYSEVLVKKGYQEVRKSKYNNMSVTRCSRYAFHIDEANKSLSVFDDFPKLTKSCVEFSFTNSLNLFTTKSFNKFLKESKQRFVSFEVGFKVLKGD
jgi:hypothetical protein